MKPYFFLIAVISVCSICCDRVVPMQEIDLRQMLYPAVLDPEKIWCVKRKVYRSISAVKMMARCCWVGLCANFRRSLLLGYFVLCSPLSFHAYNVATAFFALCNVRIFLQICKYYFGKNLLDELEQSLDFTLRLFFRILIVGAVVMTFWHLLCWSAYTMLEILQTMMAEQSCCIFFLTAAGRPQDESAQTLERPGFTIEKIGDYRRVTIGTLHWEFFEANEFDRKIFSVLLATARNENGDRVVTSRPLAEALGWSHHDLLNRCVRAWEHAGNTFVGLVDRVSNVYQGQLIEKIREILRRDFTLTLVEIRDRLHEQGWVRVSVEQIRQALKKADFNDLHDDIRNYCASHADPSRNTAFDSDIGDMRLNIERTQTGWRVILGNLFWDIDDSNRFELIGLAHMLLGAFTHEGKRITGVRALARMLELHCYQDLQKLLKKYHYIAAQFQQLQVVYETIEGGHNDDRLRNIILNMWLEDITLSATEIEKRINETPGLPPISQDKIRNLMRKVDFWGLRKQLAREYSKGQYRKSTTWVMEKYRELINHLLSQLAQGQRWSKAQINEYIDRMPAAVRQVAPQESSCEPIGKAWLKCFLFGLPKMRDGKICCPACGSFDTARKSSHPEIQIVTDHDGQSRQVKTLRFYCRNPHCSTKTFSAPIDGSHVLDQARFAKACLMLRQIITLRSPYRALANLLGTSKSVVFNELSSIAQMVDHLDEILGLVRFSGTVCIDEKFVKIAAFKKSKKRPFGYLFVAVDPATGDLLHVEIFASRDKQSAEAFLMQLKAKGIYPTTIMTDLAETYDQPVRSVYGRSVTMARCFFHFKKNIFDHMNDQFGKKNIPEIATQLKEEIFDVVDAQARKTIRQRYQALQRQKAHYLDQDPKLLPMFACIESYYPHLMRVTENIRVPIRTNNPAEQVIRHFNQRYKIMSGFKTLETARRHARLFQIVYRFTPLSNDAKIASKRGLAPLELAGYEIRHMPIYQYLTAPLLFNTEPDKNLAQLNKTG